MKGYGTKRGIYVCTVRNSEGISKVKVIHYDR